MQNSGFALPEAGCTRRYTFCDHRMGKAACGFACSEPKAHQVVLTPEQQMLLGSCHESSPAQKCEFFFACSLFRGFNEALNGLADDGWSVIESDGVDDVCISVNSSKVIGCNATFSSGLPIVSTGVLCAKASMLLQVSFTMKLELIFFLFG